MRVITQLNLLILICFEFKRSQGTYVLQIDAIRYSTTESCCDIFCGTCDNLFVFCLRRQGTAQDGSTGNCPLGSRRSSSTVDGSSFRFGSSIGGVRNPMSFTGIVWPGEVQLYIRVIDEDVAFDDHVDDIYAAIRVSPSSSYSSNQRFTGVGGTSTVTLRYRVTCSANFYGSDCATQCVGRDDDSGHYTCGTNGEVVCRSGWSEPATNCVTPYAQCDVNGTVEAGEECDDRLTADCTECGLNVVIDLNLDHPTSMNYSLEFFDLDQIVFLANTSNTFFRVSSIRNWTSIFLVMLRDPLPVDDEINIFPREAFSLSRTIMDYTGYFQSSRLVGANDPRAVGTGVDMSEVTAGVVVRGDDTFPLGDGDRLLSESEVEAIIYSAGYIARDHPGYNSRELCIVGYDGVTSDLGCVTLNFIGRNDDPPIITYASRGVATFTEGGVDYINIVDGTFNITDQDHPRYLQMAANAGIVGFMAGDPEYLGLMYTPPGFTSVYNQSTGILTISAAATPSIYEQLLLNLTYLNNMTEPRGTSRDIEVTMFDGIFTSQPATVRVNINNTNDAPAVSLDGADPVVTSLSTQYGEGAMATAIVPNLQVIDVDPDAMIQRASIVLTNGLDRDVEVLNVTLPLVGPTLTYFSSQILLSGPHSLSVYTTVLQTLTYQHLDGNPNTSESRIITFEVEDTAGATNSPFSVLNLTIIPVNDAPILFFVSNVTVREAVLVQTSGEITMSFTYTEDDPPLIVGSDIYLRDVDSTIASATIDLSNLFNGARDTIFLNGTLLSLYGVTQTTSVPSGDTTRTITLTGQAAPLEYEQILQSLTYHNLYTNDSVIDGQRVISLTTNDTYGATSNSIFIMIDVSSRNDGPVVNLGAGPNMDFMITFYEDGFSIPIVLQYVLSVMDEENHNISRITFQLLALNGDLDATDTLIPRTPFPMEFVDNLLGPLTSTLIDIAANASIELYQSVLRSIYYTNDADEPTLFNASGNPLIRVIQITIYDNRFNDLSSNLDGSVTMGVTSLTIGVTIKPVNDHAPIILLRAEPEGCASSSAGTFSSSFTSSSQQRARRSVSSALASRRKRRVKDVPDDSKAPKVVSVLASFTDQGCLDLVTVFFNTPTNAPIVATERSIQNILSFDSPEVNSAVKYGVWLDYGQLVVVFGGCIKRKTVQGVRDRGVQVSFEAERASCDWSSICSDNLVCFQNLTGCPATGPYLVAMETPCPPGSVGRGCGEGATASSSPPEFSYSEMALASILVTVTVVLIVFTFLCVKAYFTSSRSAKPLPIDLDFKDSTVISMNSELQKLPEESEVGIQDVMVVASPPPPQRGRKTTPKGTSFSVRSSVANQKKERRKIEREKKKAREGLKNEARVPILQEEETSEVDEVVTIFPEARSCGLLSQDDQTSSEKPPHLHKGGEKNDNKEEGHPPHTSHRELSISPGHQPVAVLEAEASQGGQTSESLEAELNGINQ